jgi:hypothetical protein
LLWSLEIREVLVVEGEDLAAVSGHGGCEVDGDGARSGSCGDFEREDLADLDDGDAATSNDGEEDENGAVGDLVELLGVEVVQEDV